MREFELLQHIFQSNPALPARVTIPPGDDMGAVRLDGRDLLVTVDQLIEGVHFNLATATLEQVARKAMVRNLSDVAAMAAVPVAAVATAALNRNFGESRTLALFDALRTYAEQYDCPLIGGDVSVWDGPLHLTVTVFAEPRGIEPVKRSGAKVGDNIYVTGAVGGAWNQQGGGPHLTAEPRLQLALALVTRPGVPLPGAMIDLSDGLAGDLKHICEMSHVDAEVWIESLPLRSTIADDGRPAWEHAACDGEDYELCFTAIGDVPGELEGVKITRIGRIVTPRQAGEPRIQWLNAKGEPQKLQNSGWEHGN
ncbi:MAG: thiamine-phosphate kinase [Phycisphaeraceae bacterium]